MAYKSSPPPPYSAAIDSTTTYPSLLDSFKQSLTSLTMSPSKVELEVLPFDQVDMYGEPDKDSAYTLSGQIAVTLVPPTGWFCDAPPADETFLLESLVVTFEGQSELVAPQTGHASCRLIDFSQEILLDGPHELKHSWDEGSSRNPARWFIVFNLKLPGWLPATSSTTFGDCKHDEREISYRLSAVAKYREAKPSAQSSWRNMCYGYNSVPATQLAQTRGTSVQINRYKLPPMQSIPSDSEFPEFPFPATEYSGSIQGGNSRIPLDILSKLRMRACVPEHIPVDAGSFPLLLKIRPDGLPAEERKRLHLNGFVVNATQNELLRSSMSRQYAATFPVPPESEQPPNKPLRSRRRDARAYECGLYPTHAPGTIAQASHTLLPTGFSGRIELADADAAKASFDDARFEEDDAWVRMRIDVPFRELLIDTQYLHEYAEHPVPKLRPSGFGPILSVVHTLDIALMCAWDTPPQGEGEGEAGSSTAPDRVLDELKLTIPLSFVRVPRSRPNCPSAEESSTADGLSPVSHTGAAGAVQMLPERIVPSQPYAQSLPAYNQLYHKNGMRREDPTPLPLYTPQGQSPEDVRVPTVPDMMICKQTPLPTAKTYSTPALPPLS